MWKNQYIAGTARRITRFLFKALAIDASRPNYYHEYSLPWVLKHAPTSCKILQIGCNRGEWTIPLLIKGHQVTVAEAKPTIQAVIQSKIPSGANFRFRKQSISEAIHTQEDDHYDLILCGDWICHFQDQSAILQTLKKKLLPTGTLIAGHRTKGYFLYKALINGQHAMMQTIVEEGRAGVFYCQSDQELLRLYRGLGFDAVDMLGIGILSGSKGLDPWGNWLDPEYSSRYERSRLKTLENLPIVQSTFINNASYILVAAGPIKKQI